METPKQDSKWLGSELLEAWKENAQLESLNDELRHKNSTAFWRGYFVGASLALAASFLICFTDAHASPRLTVTTCEDFRSLAYDVGVLRQQNIRHAGSYLPRDQMSQLHSKMFNSAFQWPGYHDPLTANRAAKRFRDTWYEACRWGIFHHNASGE